MADQPNILLLLSDEHSFRCFGHRDPHGDGEPVFTPAFDALADWGTVFDAAYCQVPLCTPSRICLLAGTNPMQSGGWENESYLKAGRTLPGRLGEAGYETCLVGKMHLGGDRQFVGFNHRPYGDLTGKTGHQWEPLQREGGSGMRDRTRDAGLTEIPEAMLQERIVAEQSVAFLREHRAASPEQPVFLCASFSRPHFPLSAPPRHFDRYWPDGVTEPKVGRSGDTADHPMTVGMVEGFKTDAIDHDEQQKARAGYFACVSWLDEIIGDMLAVLERDGLLENTIVIYTSDHGELAGEHGVWWKNSWHEAAARVPLIVQTPAQRSGEQAAAHLATPVSLADLLPTLCAFGRAEAPEQEDGVNLSDAIRAGEEPQRGAVWYTNPTPRWGAGTEHVVVREGRYKYVHFRAAPDLLFDLESDPLEQRNLRDRGTEEEKQRGEALRRQAEQLWDFEAAEAQCRADAALAKQHPLPDAPRAKNLFHMPGGRFVDAETPLYEPKVITKDPAAFFGDYPGTS